MISESVRTGLCVVVFNSDGGPIIISRPKGAVKDVLNTLAIHASIESSKVSVEFFREMQPLIEH